MAGRRTEEVEVKKRAEMDGSGIKSAMVVRGNLGEPEINFTLDSKGAERFGEITRENVHQRLAIILDGELYSAPVIQDAHRDGQRPDHRPVRQQGSLRAGQRPGESRSARRCTLTSPAKWTRRWAKTPSAAASTPPSMARWPFPSS